METPVDTGENVTEAAAPVAHEAHAQTEPTQESVPVAALQAERKERQQLQEKLKVLEDHLVLMQSNAQQQAKPQEMDGLSDDDVLTVGEFKKALGQKEQQYKMDIEELRVSRKHPDYDEVVTKYLPDVIKANPALKTTLQNDPNRYELAYFLAKNSDSYRNATHERKKSKDAQRIVENSQRAGSLSAVGSTAPQGSVSSYKNMSDDEFMKMANRNRGQF